MDPILYSHDDASAPVLAGQSGKLLDILDKCLVTGYGSKPAAGWSKAFTGTNLAAFKPAVGSSSQLIRVDDTQARETRVRLYRTMSAISTGTGPAPSSSGYVRWYKSINSSSTPRAWWLVADDRGFFLVVHNTLAIGDPDEDFRYPVVYGCGDVLPFNSGDPTPFFLAGQSTSDSTDSTYYPGRCLLPYASPGLHYVAPTGADTHIWFSANAAGANSPQAGLAIALGPEYDLMPSGGASNYSNPQSPFLGGLFVSDVFLTSGTQGPRGRLPGMLHLPHVDRFTDWLPVDIPGRGSCLPIPFSDGINNPRGQVLIRLEDWRV